MARRERMRLELWRDDYFRTETETTADPEDLDQARQHLFAAIRRTGGHITRSGEYELRRLVIDGHTWLPPYTHVHDPAHDPDN
ncbi:MAG: hypothetical protein ACRCZP_16385 [Phycicoccus sp.]